VEKAVRGLLRLVRLVARRHTERACCLGHSRENTVSCFGRWYRKLLTKDRFTAVLCPYEQYPLPCLQRLQVRVALTLSEQDKTSVLW